MLKLFTKLLQTLSKNPKISCYKNFSSSPISNQMKVTVLGAAGKVGEPLCLMLKQSPLIDELCIYDVKSTTPLALELNHVDTNCKVCHFSGRDSLPNALQNSNVVVILASAPNAEALSLEEMWECNNKIIRDLAAEIGKNSAKAFVALGTEPINSLLPMLSEILKKHSAYDPNRVFGITSIDSVRSNTFVSQVQGIDPEHVVVPVVGGHSPETIIPVLSHAKPCHDFSNEELENLVTSIRNARENMLSLKPGETGPLSIAFAAARFVISLVKAIQGYPEVVETAYVASKVHPYLKYMATPLLLGPNGVMKNLGIPKLSDFEQCMFDNAVPILANDIKKGEKFVGVIDPPPPCSECAPPRASCPVDYCNLPR